MRYRVSAWRIRRPFRSAGRTASSTPALERDDGAWSARNSLLTPRVEPGRSVSPIEREPQAVRCGRRRPGRRPGGGSRARRGCRRSSARVAYDGDGGVADAGLDAHAGQVRGARAGARWRGSGRAARRGRRSPRSRRHPGRARRRARARGRWRPSPRGGARPPCRGDAASRSARVDRVEVADDAGRPEARARARARGRSRPRSRDRSWSRSRERGRGRCGRLPRTRTQWQTRPMVPSAGITRFRFEGSATL